MTKSVKNILIIGGIVGVGYAIYRYFKKQIGLITNYDYKIIGVRIKKLTKNEVVFDIKTRFFNKSKIEATINKIYLNVLVEGYDVGYITENKPFIIPSEGSSDIDLQISANPQFVLKNALGILLGGVKRKDLKFTIDGYANIKSGFISTTLPVKFSDIVSAYI